MHILFFNRSYYPDTTATGQLLTQLCESLVRDHGCRVSVVTGPPLLPTSTVAKSWGLVSHSDHERVRIHRVWGTRFDKRRFVGRATNYLSYFLSACYAGLRVDRPDVVVALTDPPIIGLAAWLAGRRAGAPLVMAFKDLFPEVTALLPDFHSETINKALQRITRWLVRHASANIALGETMRQRLILDKGASPERTTIIADWADTTTITPRPKHNPFSTRLALADKFVVMHSGNLGLAQSLDTMLDAADLLRDIPALQIVFVGEGVKKAELQARAASLGLTNVTFLPFSPESELSDSFATADVFVVSLQRGLAGYIVPSKIYGILAAGRPYVAAVEDDCEVAALTSRHACGLLAGPGDARTLADRIRLLYRDPTMRARLGANARAASGEFERRTQVAKYMAVFQQVARGATVDELARTVVGTP